jgi:hypothetical protein
MCLNLAAESHRKPSSSEALCDSCHTQGHDDRVQHMFNQYATHMTILLTRHFSAIGTVPVHVTALAVHLPTHVMQPLLAQDMWAPWAR